MRAEEWRVIEVGWWVGTRSSLTLLALTFRVFASPSRERPRARARG